MNLIHTLLFLLRQKNTSEDIDLAKENLKSLEKSSYSTLVVYNQGPMSNEELEDFLHQFDLHCIIIGEGINVGITAGRQSCFQYIWDHYPDTGFISELHMDMIFPPHWEDAMLEYLNTTDEPAVSVGIINKKGTMPFVDDTVRKMPDNFEAYSSFLSGLCCNKIVHGFTHPCIHKSAILKETGGYNTHFLKGRQCFEDDSLLLGYYYYYGTKADWHPKINLNSVVYHAVALQRLDIHGNININLDGLIKQYGAMGMKSLSHLHKSAWHKNFFQDKYNEMAK